MWKRYDALSAHELAAVNAMYNGDVLYMGAKNLAEIRRQYGYWCEGGNVHARRKTNLIVDWNQQTLY